MKWHKPLVDWSDSRYDWLRKVNYVTAKDVKFTVDLILNLQVECPDLRSRYMDLDYCKVIDDYTIVFRWKKKLYNSLVFTADFSPIPKFIYSCDEDGNPYPHDILGTKFNSHWYNNRFIGCGPYEFIYYKPRFCNKAKKK